MSKSKKTPDNPLDADSIQVMLPNDNYDFSDVQNAHSINPCSPSSLGVSKPAAPDRNVIEHKGFGKVFPSTSSLLRELSSTTEVDSSLSLSARKSSSQKLSISKRNSKSSLVNNYVVTAARCTSPRCGSATITMDERDIIPGQSKRGSDQFEQRSSLSGVRLAPMINTTVDEHLPSTYSDDLQNFANKVMPADSPAVPVTGSCAIVAPTKKSKHGVRLAPMINKTVDHLSSSTCSDDDLQKIFAKKFMSASTPAATLTGSCAIVPMINKTVDHLSSSTCSDDDLQKIFAKKFMSASTPAATLTGSCAIVPMIHSSTCSDDGLQYFDNKVMPANSPAASITDSCAIVASAKQSKQLKSSDSNQEEPVCPSIPEHISGPKCDSMSLLERLTGVGTKILYPVAVIARRGRLSPRTAVDCDQLVNVEKRKGRSPSPPPHPRRLRSQAPVESVQPAAPVESLQKRNKM